jgi:hypothetical protein
LRRFEAPDNGKAVAAKSPTPNTQSVEEFWNLTPFLCKVDALLFLRKFFLPLAPSDLAESLFGRDFGALPVVGK